MSCFTDLCNDTGTRGDIQSVVHTMLSPLLRTENSRHTDVFVTSTTASNALQAVDCTEASTDSILGDQSKEDSDYIKVH